MILQQRRTVLITRPEPYGSKLADEVRHHGYEPLLDPIIKFCAWTQPCPQIACDGVLFTSQTALRFLDHRQDEIKTLLDKDCFCIGERTAQAAKLFGFRNVLSADGDSEAIVRLACQYPAKTLLYITRRDYKEDIRQSLIKKGKDVVVWPVYEVSEVNDFHLATKESLRNQHIDIALFLSEQTSRCFIKLVEKNKLQSCCSGIVALGLSPTIGAVLKECPFKEIRTAEKPEQGSLMDLLDLVAQNEKVRT